MDSQRGTMSSNTGKTHVSKQVCYVQLRWSISSRLGTKGLRSSLEKQLIPGTG